MKLLKRHIAFTLVELMVWITLIGILIVWTSNIDFNRLNSKQNLEIFTNNLKNNIEKIRNNSLSGKWILSNSYVPEKWKIEYSTSNSWTIISSTYNWTDWTKYEENNFLNGYNISKINCLQINKTVDEDISSSTWTIEFEWSKLKLNWCTNTSSKILEIVVNYRWYKKILQVNSLNWLIEIK